MDNTPKIGETKSIKLSRVETELVRVLVQTYRDEHYLQGESEHPTNTLLSKLDSAVVSRETRESDPVAGELGKAGEGPPA